MDEVFGKCIICGKQTGDAVDGYDNDTGDLTGACDSCRAAAALGWAVRRFDKEQGIRKSGPYFCFHDDTGDYAEWDTPEAALKDAGLMEVKG